MANHQNGSNGQLPPFDAEAEAGALACILSADHKEATDFLAQVNLDHFYDERHREIHRALTWLKENSKHLNIVELSQLLKDQGRMDDAGGSAYIARLPDQTPSAHNFPTYLEIVKDRSVRRAVIRDAAEISILARDQSIATATLSDATRNLLHAYSQNGHGVEHLLGQKLFNPAIRPPEIRTVYSLNDVTICTPGNLTSITSAIKTGKSAVIGAMCASAMAHVENADLLGFESHNHESKAIVHFDSEQSPEDHWHHVDNTIRRAGLLKVPPWFFSYCLTGLVAKKALECVLEAMRIAREEFGGLHSVFIDGFADLVKDVNDAAECNDFIARMHGLAIDYFCSNIGVLHLNPGTEKSRGHLGSQLERKAETNLVLEKNKDEVTVIYSTKNRRAGIPKHTGPCFAWSPDSKMHISVQNDLESAQSRAGRPSKTSQIACMNLHSFLAKCTPAGEGRKEIARRLESWLAANSIAASFDTAKRATDCLVANGKLMKSPETGLFLRGPNA